MLGVVLRGVGAISISYLGPMSLSQRLMDAAVCSPEYRKVCGDVRVEVCMEMCSTLCWSTKRGACLDKVGIGDSGFHVGIHMLSTSALPPA